MQNFYGSFWVKVKVKLKLKFTLEQGTEGE